MTSTLRPPVKWHGGKHYLARRICDLFPAHHTYVVPFGGAASVLLNKEPVSVEIYNDLDERITRLFRVLREEGEELRRRLTLTPYSEIEFENTEDPCDDEVELARRDLSVGACLTVAGAPISVSRDTDPAAGWLTSFLVFSRRSTMSCPGLLSGSALSRFFVVQPSTSSGTGMDRTRCFTAIRPTYPRHGPQEAVRFTASSCPSRIIVIWPQYSAPAKARSSSAVIHPPFTTCSTVAGGPCRSTCRTTPPVLL